VVLDQGCVVEVGRHEELLMNKGVYSKLYAINYGIDDDGDTVESTDTITIPADND
jgi:hypothetical protein